MQEFLDNTSLKPKIVKSKINIGVAPTYLYRRVRGIGGKYPFRYCMDISLTKNKH